MSILLESHGVMGHHVGYTTVAAVAHLDTGFRGVKYALRLTSHRGATARAAWQAGNPAPAPPWSAEQGEPSRRAGLVRG